MVIKKKTKKVLLGFVTTSFILLVMIAPTTPTTTASLEQQEDNETSSAVANARTDDPFIPIGPTEGAKEPDEPIPDNENETDDDDDNSTATTLTCKDIGYNGTDEEFKNIPECPGNDDNDDGFTCLVSAESDQGQPCAGFCDHGACAKIGPERYRRQS